MKQFTLPALLFLSACASAPAPQPAPSPVVNRQSLPAETADSGAAESQQRPAEILASEPRNEGDSRNPAVADLLAMAEQGMGAGEYNRSVALAERAMLIDRYDPEVYLLLARAHRSLGNLALSRQYAARGLAYTEPGSLIYANLQALR